MKKHILFHERTGDECSWEDALHASLEIVGYEDTNRRETLKIKAQLTSNWKCRRGARTQLSKLVHNPKQKCYNSFLNCDQFTPVFCL